MPKLKLQYFGHLMQRTNSWKKPWCWERLKVKGEGGMAEDDMVLYNHWLNRHEFEKTPGDNGEGNGNPFHYSCLEKPVDRGPWWAAVHGVSQRWTWLKRLSSSSSSWEIMEDREARHAAVHGVAKCQIQLSDWTATCFKEAIVNIF